MECKTTSTRKRSSSAFTLVEILVATAIGSVVVLVLAQITFYTGRSFAALMNYTELDRYSRNALDQMVTKIRQANGLKTYTTNRMVFTYMTTNELIYQYSPSDKTLTETLD